MPSFSTLLFGDISKRGSPTQATVIAGSRWFPGIRRCSSSSSASSSSFGSVAGSREHGLLDEFESLYQLAKDEIGYATESQGSIYYGGDLVAAKEAVDSCLAQYHQLLQYLDQQESVQFDTEWAVALVNLRTRLDGLPSPNSLA